MVSNTTENPCAQADSGFTLVEVVVGTVIIVVALVAIIGASVNHAKTRRVSEETGQAFVACRNTIEEIRSMPVEDLPALNGTGFDVPGADDASRALQAAPGDLDGLPGEIVVGIEREQGAEILYRVQARVVWRGASGNRTFELQTLVGSR